MKRFLAIILLVASMLVGPASAQDAAKGFVEGLLESVLAAEGRSLSIEGVGISLTGDLTVAKVTVRDGNDAWLEIEQLSLVWRPLSLFSKQLDITSLAAGRVHVKRMPQSPEGKVAAPPELTDLRAAVIRQLDINRLQIDQPVLGQDVEMKLAGSAEITASPIEIRADMTASRLDGRRGDLNARVVLDPQTRQITLDAGFSEDADGVIANLLALRGDPSVDARHFGGRYLRRLVRPLQSCAEPKGELRGICHGGVGFAWPDHHRDGRRRACTAPAAMAGEAFRRGLHPLGKGADTQGRRRCRHRPREP